MEVYDDNGNYFKKRVIIDGQGDTSMKLPKRNFAVDFCEDEWKGDKTTVPDMALSKECPYFDDLDLSDW